MEDKSTATKPREQERHKRMDNELIFQFWKENKDKYKHLNIGIEEATILCRAPFTQLKFELVKETMRDCRLPYLGIFKVKPTKLIYDVKFSVESIKSGKHTGTIGLKIFNERMTRLKKRIAVAPEQMKNYTHLYEDLLKFDPYEFIHIK